MSAAEFTNAYLRIEPFLTSFAYRLTQSEDKAKELVQETAYKAFKHQKMYKPHTNIKAWLMTIMRNTFINDYRRHKRRQTFNDNSTNLYFINSGQTTVNNTGESALTLSEIHAVLEDLDDWMKVPFLMYLNGYKYDEIASELNIPLGTVKSRIFFARRKLKQVLRVMYGSYNVLDN